MDCKFLMNPASSEQKFNDPNLKAAIICSDDLVVTFHRKKVVKMNQSWAIGFSVLEVSKLVMQRLFYREIRPKFPEGVSVVMSDTDSFVLLTKQKCSDEVVSRLKKIMDFSNYPKSHHLYDETRKNALGLIKNEIPQDDISDFCGVRAKSYAINTLGQTLTSRAKGVKSAFREHLTFQDYKSVVLSKSQVSREQYGFLSKDHVIRMVKSNKVCFSSLEDKRYWLCERHSVPFGSRIAKANQKRIWDGHPVCPFCADKNEFV